MGRLLEKRHDSTPQSGVEAPRLLKRSLSRLYCCCCWCWCGWCGWCGNNNQNITNNKYTTTNTNTKNNNICSLAFCRPSVRRLQAQMTQLHLRGYHGDQSVSKAICSACRSAHESQPELREVISTLKRFFAIEDVLRVPNSSAGRDGRGQFEVIEHSGTSWSLCNPVRKKRNTTMHRVTHETRTSRTHVDTAKRQSCCDTTRQETGRLQQDALKRPRSRGADWCSGLSYRYTAVLLECLNSLRVLERERLHTWWPQDHPDKF